MSIRIIPEASESQRARSVFELTAPDALKSGLPFGALIVFTLLTFLNLPNRIEALGFIRPTVLMLLLMTGLLVGHAQALSPKWSIRGARWFWYLLTYIVVTLPLVVYPGSVLSKNFEIFAKWAVFFPLVIAFADTERRLRIFVYVFVGCTLVRCLEPLLLHVTQGYWGSHAYWDNAGDGMERLAGAPTDLVNPNGLAFLCVTALPFLHYWANCRGAGWPRKLIYALLGPALVYALILTASRSGLLALGLEVVVFALFSKRRTLALAGLALAVVMVLPHLTGDQLDRYASIYDKNARNATTAQGRIEGMQQNIELVTAHPVFGYGLGTSLEAAFNFQGGTHYAHNLYLEVLIELGVGGFIIMMGYLGSLWRTCRMMVGSIRKLETQLPDGHILLWLPKVLLLWVAMCLFFSFFSFGLSGYEWYLVGALGGVSERLMQTRLRQEAQPAEASEPAFPAPRIPRTFSRRRLSRT